MESFGDILVGGANGLWWLYEAVISLALAVYGTVDVVLNPVMSTVLSVLNPIGNVLGDVVYGAMSVLPPAWGLVIISAITGVVMLFMFKFTSNQQAIVAAKDTIKANLLALKLYKDEIRVTFISQWQLMLGIARLQWHMFKPVVIVMLPMLVGLSQMGIRYQWRALHTGEEAYVHVYLDEPLAHEVSLEPGSGAEVEVSAMAGESDYAWRIRAREPGVHTLKFQVDSETIEKELVVGDGLERVSVERTGANWATQLFHPVEALLSSSSPVSRIEIKYPDRVSWIYGSDYWVLTFFVVSMLVALVLAPVFKVKF